MPFSRLVRFLAKDGKTYYGDALVPSGATDLTGVAQAKVIQGTPWGQHHVTERILDVQRLLAPLAREDIRTVRCLGLNYEQHAVESNMPIPKYPVLFYKPVTSVAGPFDKIPVSTAAQEGEGLDYECELVAVIGKEGTNISEAQALSHVAGYAVGNDVSHRDWQLKRGGGQWGLGKGFDAWAPIGPAIVSTSLISDPQNLRITTKLNGETVQDSNTGDMIFGVAKTISILSQGTTLLPGDLIFTGTSPQGVGMGRKPQLWLKDGDVVEVNLEGVGSCINKVQFEGRSKALESRQIICAVSESRGIAPTVGLAFINLDTGEAVLSQIPDTQSYVRTLHKLAVFSPSQILILNTTSNPKSKLFSLIEENLDDLNSNMTLLDRRYWAETTGIELIEQFAFVQDVDSIKMSVDGNYFSVCCFAAAMKYIELAMSKTFPAHSLRIKYEASEGSMMIDLSTIRSLELIQNLQNHKSRDCLFGILNETLTPMGGRLLRSNVLQPLTDQQTLETRYDSLEELSTKEEMFFSTRTALKTILDADKMLTQLIIIPTKPSLLSTEQSINNIILLKQFIGGIQPIYEALTGAKSVMLREIQRNCMPGSIDPIKDLIDEFINEDINYAKQPLELRNQRTYAVKSGVNGLLDVARQTYKEANMDVYELVEQLQEAHKIPLELKYDNARQYYLRLNVSELEDRNLPPLFINVIRKNNKVECSTLDLRKRSQKISDSHTEVLLMSDKIIQELIVEIRVYMSILFKVSESIAMLDVLSSFAHNITLHEYVRPRITQTLGLKAARHPIREKVQSSPYIPNDVYATQQSRFQIITGCNMSGKSTYIRSIALLTVMAQVGCFVPAEFASFPIIKQLFARISIDDSIEANVSTFASEMRETAFILRNINKDSMVIIDELGRGTSPRDGLAIALAIAEALVDSRALVWFATHFRDLAKILAERNGVVNRHLAVDMSEADTMAMLYRLTDGVMSEQHYGLQLAKVMPLPPDVIEFATKVAEKLQRQVERKKKASKAVILARKRKLILALREELEQACGGAMEGLVLQSWLQELQREFGARMRAIDQEAEEADYGSLDLDDDDTTVSEHMTNDTGSVVYQGGDEATSSHYAESMVEDDSNIGDRY
ncbi:hypothetical protein E4T47_04890 [Aureobasidium subglaciale]|nr:hypothetical protein E4T47_04890 [Aureobasidium subglaciale]